MRKLWRLLRRWAGAPDQLPKTMGVRRSLVLTRVAMENAGTGTQEIPFQR